MSGTFVSRIYSSIAKASLVAKGPIITPKHDAAYWDRVTAGFDFFEADQVPTAAFNRVLWAGLMGDKPYPTLRGRTSQDLPPHLAWARGR